MPAPLSIIQPLLQEITHFVKILSHLIFPGNLVAKLSSMLMCELMGVVNKLAANLMSQVSLFDPSVSCAMPWTLGS